MYRHFFPNPVILGVLVFLNLWLSAFAATTLSLSTCARSAAQVCVDDNEYLRCRLKKLLPNVAREESFCNYILQKEGCDMAASIDGFQRFCCKTYAKACSQSAKLGEGDGKKGGINTESAGVVTRRRALAEKTGMELMPWTVHNIQPLKRKPIFCKHMEKTLKRFGFNPPGRQIFREVTTQKIITPRHRRRVLFAVTPSQLLEEGLREAMQGACENAAISDYASLAVSLAYVIKEVGNRLRKCNHCVDQLFGTIFQEFLPDRTDNPGVSLTTEHFTENFLQFLYDWGTDLSKRVGLHAPSADLDFESFWTDYFYASFENVFDSDRLGGLVTYSNLPALGDLFSKHHVQKAVKMAYPRVFWIHLKCGRLMPTASQHRMRADIASAMQRATPSIASWKAGFKKRQRRSAEPEVDPLRLARIEKEEKQDATLAPSDNTDYCNALNRTVEAFVPHEWSHYKTMGEVFPSLLLRIAKLPSSMSDVRLILETTTVKSYKQLLVDFIVVLQGIRSRLINCHNCLDAFIVRLSEDGSSGDKDDLQHTGMETVGGQQVARAQLTSRLLDFMRGLANELQRRTEATPLKDDMDFDGFCDYVSDALKQLSKDYVDFFPSKALFDDAKTSKAAGVVSRTFWEKHEIHVMARREGAKVYNNHLTCARRQLATTEEVAETRSYCRLLNKAMRLYKIENIDEVARIRRLGDFSFPSVLGLQNMMELWGFHGVTDFKTLLLMLPELAKQTQKQLEKCPECAIKFIEAVFEGLYKDDGVRNPVLSATKDELAERYVEFLGQFSKKLQEIINSRAPQSWEKINYDVFYSRYLQPALNNSWKGSQDFGGLVSTAVGVRLFSRAETLRKAAGKEMKRLYIYHLQCPKLLRDATDEVEDLTIPLINSRLKEETTTNEQSRIETESPTITTESLTTATVTPATSTVMAQTTIPTIISSLMTLRTVGKERRATPDVPSQCTHDDDDAFFDAQLRKEHQVQNDTKTLCAAFTADCNINVNLTDILDEACPESRFKNQRAGTAECIKHFNLTGFLTTGTAVSVGHHGIVAILVGAAVLHFVSHL